MELNTPQDYIKLAERRKWWIIIPFVLVMMGSVVVYKKLPKIYEAKTLILVQPQKIPKTYVESTVSQTVSDRMATVSQQILSRSNLQQVITQLQLTKHMSDPLQIEGKIGSMRKATKIEVHHERGETTGSFSISFEDKNPEEAARIVNEIASLFIAENLKGMEEQARFTSQFLEKELQDIEKRLKQKEEAIRKFKEHYMGELPVQLDANLRILERLQQEVQTNNQTIIAVQQRKANLENLINQMRKEKTSTQTNKGPLSQEDLLETKLNDERRRLQELQTQYTDHHPDIITAKANLAQLEAQFGKSKANVASSGPEKTTSPPIDPTLIRLNADLQEAIDHIYRLTNEEADLKHQIVLYQRRVENVPKREEELSALLRDYSLLQENYNSLLEKKTQAQLAENLEKRHKGEQFRILDVATPPMSPVRPDRVKFFSLAFVLGIGLSGGLAFMRENLDRSFYKADDVEQLLGFPVIATIPRIQTKKAKGNNAL